MERDFRGGPRRFGGGGGSSFGHRGDGGFGGQRSFAPVKVGDILDVKIESVGAKGDGVAKVQGFVLFVPGVEQGQEVKVKVTRVLRKAGFAEVVGSEGAATEAPAEGAEEQASEEQPAEGEQAAEEQPAEAVAEEPAEDSESFGDEEQQ